MRSSRTIAGLVAALALGAAPARAQAPTTGLLVLLLPASPRATALGNAWVAGRDDYSIFYNPAQVAPTNGIGVSLARYGPGAAQGAVASAATLGTVTIGWGVQLAELRAPSSTAYPFVPADIVRDGDRDALTFLAVAGANRVFKGFRTGVAVQFAEDRLEASLGSPVGIGTGALARRLLADVGVSHTLLSGTAALAVQHIDDGRKARAPLQTAVGWARQFQPGQVDIGVATQVLARRGWVSPAGGVELGYGWIEGWSATLRAGARRPETSAQRPLTFGAGLNADRLALDYAVELYAGNRVGHHLGLRVR